MNETVRKIRVLTLADKAKVVHWLNTNHEWLQNKPTFAEATRRCQTDTGLRLHEHAIRHIAEAFGLSWEPIRITGGKASSRAHERITELTQRLEVVEKQIRETALHADILQLRDHLHHLYVQLGAKPPVKAVPQDNGRVP